MARHDLSFPAKRPIAVWNQPLKVDLRGLFGSLCRGLVGGVTGQWAEVGSSSVDLLTSLGLDARDAPQLAWVLIRRSLLAAMSELVREVESSHPRSSGEPLEELAERIDETIAAEPVTIDRGFFERPGSLSLLEVVEGPFSTWLEAYGVVRAEAEMVARRLPSYFVFRLHEEWRFAAGAYEAIREAIDTPFTQAAERERAWAAYRAYLQRQIDEPMFGELFGLRQVYVPLRAFYLIPSEGAVEEGPLFKASPQRHGRRVVIDPQAELEEWLGSNDRNDGYRVISGGPGSGKSSLVRRLAARLAESPQSHLLLIPLRQLNLKGRVESSVGDFVRSTGILPTNPLDPETAEDRLLIVFDGLDELFEQGRLAADTAREFVREVLRYVEVRNDKRRRLLVIFTGREPIVQATESVFREPRRVVHVLPYLITKDAADPWQGGQAPLDDQRDTWWKLYGRAKGSGEGGLPAELQRRDLEEITAQPLLNYLVALSRARGKLLFSSSPSLGDIYEDLLTAVYERAWEKGPHRATAQLDPGEFGRLLEEIALSAWHGNLRTATVAEIAKHCEEAGLLGILQRHQVAAKEGVSRALTAFYFRQHGRTESGESTFEFTHKSFREYLTARRIVRALERMEEETGRRYKGFDVGWDEQTALRHWIEICGPAPMDSDLKRFVKLEMDRRGTGAAERWQPLLSRLVAAMVRWGPPVDALLPRPSFRDEVRLARNAEEAMLVVLNLCAWMTRKRSQIHGTESGAEASRRNAGLWISRLRGQRGDVPDGLAAHHLSWLDLRGCNFAACSLAGADLRHSDLSQADLSLAGLQGANLSEAILEGANLREAGLRGASLNNANLTRADLRRADLQYADLRNAKLDKADLRGFDWRWAQQQGATKRGAQVDDPQKDSDNPA